MTAIASKMTGVADDLSKTETGKPVQSRQKTIVRDLDELIASLEKQCQDCKQRHEEEQPDRAAWTTR